MLNRALSDHQRTMGKLRISRILVLDCFQGIIQKKSASVSWTLPCLVIFFRNFILIWKYQKRSLNRGTLVSETAINQTKCPFTVLSALFMFFQTLPYDSKLFPGFVIEVWFMQIESKDISSSICQVEIEVRILC